jgi:hypothetical protein
MNFHILSVEQLQEAETLGPLFVFSNEDLIIKNQQDRVQQDSYEDDPSMTKSTSRRNGAV